MLLTVNVNCRSPNGICAFEMYQIPPPNVSIVFATKNQFIYPKQIRSQSDPTRPSFQTVAFVGLGIQ